MPRIFSEEVGDFFIVNWLVDLYQMPNSGFFDVGTNQFHERRLKLDNGECLQILFPLPLGFLHFLLNSIPACHRVFPRKPVFRVFFKLFDRCIHVE